MPDAFSSDAELMLALAQDDHSALRPIIEKWERPLFSFAHRYTQNDEATRDIVQETFARVYLKRLSYDARYPLSSWIFTIAANLCKNKARWRRRHPEVSIETLGGGGEGTGGADLSCVKALASDAPLPSAAVVEVEEMAVLRAAVMALPHDLKTAILLHHYENLSYKEIADVVGCSIRGVETRLYRARKLLRKRVEPLLERGGDAVEKKTAYPISGGAADSLAC